MTEEIMLTHTDCSKFPVADPSLVENVFAIPTPRRTGTMSKEFEDKSIFTKD
jgi:hypothetical protein